MSAPLSTCTLPTAYASFAKRPRFASVGYAPISSDLSRRAARTWRLRPCSDAILGDLSRRAARTRGLPSSSVPFTHEFGAV